MTTDNRTSALHDQKAKLLEQVRQAQKKLADFDTKRSSVIASLAKRYKLSDLSDTVLEEEFANIADKYLKTQDKKIATNEKLSLNITKKN